MIASATLSGCGPSVECRAPLTAAECLDALRQAQAALDQHPAWIADERRPAGLTMVWDACQDADCAEHLDGFAFVRLVDAHDQPIGHFQVCIEAGLCGEQEAGFGFP